MCGIAVARKFNIELVGNYNHDMKQVRFDANVAQIAVPARLCLNGQDWIEITGPCGPCSSYLPHGGGLFSYPGLEQPDCLRNRTIRSMGHEISAVGPHP